MLNAQKIILTGAAQGLGAAIARRYASLGAQMVLMDYNGEGLAQTVADCNGKAEAITVDLADAKATQAAIDQAIASLGGLTTVIHNAAILFLKPFEEETFESFFKTVNVGLQAGFQLASAAWPIMKKNGGGSLVFVSSRSGIEGHADESGYCAAKHALEGFSQSLAEEGAPHGIISNTITPGMYMHTPMSERNYPPELKTQWVDPMMLTSAFVSLALREHPENNGKRLSAWELSQSIDNAR